MLIRFSSVHSHYWITCIGFNKASICRLLLVLTTSLSHVLVRLIFSILLLLQFNFRVIYYKIVYIVICYNIGHNFWISMLLSMIPMVRASMVIILIMAAGATSLFCDFTYYIFAWMIVLRRACWCLVSIVIIITLWSNVLLLATTSLRLRRCWLINNFIATFIVFIIKRSTLTFILIRLILRWCVEIQQFVRLFVLLSRVIRTGILLFRLLIVIRLLCVVHIIFVAFVILKTGYSLQASFELAGLSLSMCYNFLVVWYNNNSLGIAFTS